MCVHVEGVGLGGVYVWCVVCAVSVWCVWYAWGGVCVQGVGGVYIGYVWCGGCVCAGCG